MTHSEELLPLFSWLFGESAYLAEEANLPRLRRWGRAAREWVEIYRKEKGEGTSRLAAAALRDFFTQLHKAPWEVTPADVEAFAEGLRQQGKRARQKLQFLSLFYETCAQNVVDPACGEEFNPVRTVKKADVKNFSGIVVLGRLEVDALLQAVDRESSLLGKRGYAMLLVELATALPSTPLRRLRWGDLERNAQQAPVAVTPGRAMAEAGENLHRFDLPAEAAAAVIDYLSSAGRLESIRPEEILFAPTVSKAWIRLEGKADEWDANRPASHHAFDRELKHYAEWAGLDGKEVTWTTLRHTAIAFYLQAGHSLEETLAWQNRKQTPGTRKYLYALERALARRERLDRAQLLSQQVQKRRKPRGSLPGEGGNYRHGFKTPYIHASEREEYQRLVEQEGDTLFGREIARIRLIVMRLAVLAQDCDDPDKLARYLSIATTATGRLEKMIRARREWGGEG